ncbi:MAG: endolytic transglycosylase MltG [Candidatus Gracilibacteria bacterium]|nr:endolytic transglycosylase MltG [Candidatus Gracilibacteria bacterium]
MIKFFTLFYVIISGFISIAYGSNNEIGELQNTNFHIAGKTISGEKLYRLFDQGLDNKYLDPQNKMNFVNNLLTKLEKIDSQKSDNLKKILIALWKKYSEQVLENKRNSSVTILEGWNIFDIDTILTQRSLIKKGDYIQYVESSEKIEALSEFFDFLENQKTLEGYLYPDTYTINPQKFKINNFVILQLNTFESKVYNRLFIDEVQKTPLYNNSIIESVINLASIVEKEEKNNDEKPKVAGILKKRLKEFRHIGADATVCYPLRITSNTCRYKVSKHIHDINKYNTRKHIGLPPTPISNPSYQTVNATLNDLETEYYYYLHQSNTGKIYYAENYEEHKKNIELYLKYFEKK